MRETLKRRGAAFVALAAFTGMLAGCSSETSRVGAPDVDVDTPALRDLRRSAGLDPCPPTGGEDAAAPARSLPDLTLPCLGGGADVTLAELRGPLVINVWAQWCEPCRTELPLFQRLHETGKVDVLGINWQDPLPEQAVELLAESGVTYPSVADPGAELSRFYPDLRGLPMSILVDRRGRVVTRAFLVLRRWSDLRDLIEEDLGVSL